MKRNEIKRIMVVYSDNDFVRVWDWIGKVALMTIQNDTNICGCKVLEDSEDIENFIKSLLPSGIEFLQYREDKYSEYCLRYRNINKEEVNRLTNCFSNIRFKYNFDDTDSDYEFGGSEILIIDLENNQTYLR